MEQTELLGSKAEKRQFRRMVMALVVPMALQNLINVAVNAADVIMLGKVSETALSGASLAGQVQFIMTLIFFGITSGAAVLTAQYWGKGNTGAIERIMGIAMGTSEAVGYVDKDQNVLGWVSELAFAPVDLSEEAEADEWSTDIGAGCKYFSQDAVIKLAPRAGIALDEILSPADQLKQVQQLMEGGDERAAKVFRDIGIYLAHTVVLYARFYDIEKLILMGRVMSGKGGEIILSTARQVLMQDHPALAKTVTLMLPDEKTRRIGQAVAAASLPEIRK